MSEVHVAFYGDDFTGSVDVLLQFAREGWRGRLFTAIPSRQQLRAAAEETDVVGIAGVARSLPPGMLEDELRPALHSLLSVNPRVIQYKACSTADSSPQVGSIGRAIEIGREESSGTTVPILFAQPDFGRYTAFGHHFAAEDGVVYRLDRQPTMAHHPTTPMDESDLVRHLSRQTSQPLTHIPFTQYTDASALADMFAQPVSAIVLDALDENHLRLIGEAIWKMPAPVFAVGSGGLSTALAATRPHRGQVLPTWTDTDDPVLAISGSRSQRTRRQVAAAAESGWLVEPLLPLSGERIRHAHAALQNGRSVVLTSPEAHIDHDDHLEALSHAGAEAIAGAVRAGLCRRVIVCGGDTSSRITRLLGVDALSIAANPYGNVVVCRTHSTDAALDGVEIILKGGQVGDDELFEQVRTHTV